MQEPLFDILRPSAVKEQLCDLWQEAFGDGREFVDAFFENIPCDECAHTLSVDGRVVSALYTLPCVLRAGDKDFSAVYIYAVATHPCYRGRGYMQVLMRRVEEVLRATGVEFVFLLPATERLRAAYSMLGFKDCSRMSIECVVAPSSVSTDAFRFAEVDDFEALWAFYVDVQRRRPFSLLHSRGSIAMNVFNCREQGGGVFALYEAERMVAAAFAIKDDKGPLLLELLSVSAAAERFMLRSLSDYQGGGMLRRCLAGRGAPHCMGLSLSLPFEPEMLDVPLSLLLDK